VIVVAGFNTSVDRFVEVGTIEIGGLARAKSALALPGGKGVHVALTAAALGVKTELVGIIDPRHRSWFSSYLEERGVTFRAVTVDDEIRTCLAVKDGSGRVTEILEPGPELSREAQGELVALFLGRALQASVAVISGSLPQGLDAATYRSLVMELERKGVRTLLDSSGEALRLGLEAGPYLVKPNRNEAEALLGRPIVDSASALGVAGTLGERCPVVIVSLGEEGGVASWEGRLAQIHTTPLAAQNPTGSGDCLLGGVATGLARELGPEGTLRLGAACGAANTLSPGAGVLRVSDIRALEEGITVRWLN
jgi:1-phosphofructokinase family hexose kinase